MVTGVYVPRWGITMERGLVVEWLAREGQQVTKGQPLFEMETEKLNGVVEALADGVLRAVLIPAGEKGAVGDLIAVLADPEEAFDVEALRRAAQAAATGTGVARQRREARPAERTARGAARASPAARRLAQAHGLDVAAIAGTGPQGSISREDVAQAITDAVAATLEDTYVTVDGLRLRYLAAGGAATGLRARDLTAVLVHGLGGSTMLWQPNLTALAANQRIIALDLPGHGLSDKPPAEYNVAFFAGKLAGVLDALGLEHSAATSACGWR
ncbi:MAG: alpha/beta fold hydrolase [Chloroflexi bacterium]|nr:alpha/beta fold hydrolase [Chloroflexota bacterium]